MFCSSWKAAGRGLPPGKDLHLRREVAGSPMAILASVAADRKVHEFGVLCLGREIFLRISVVNNIEEAKRFHSWNLLQQVTAYGFTFRLHGQ